MTFTNIKNSLYEQIHTESSKASDGSDVPSDMLRKEIVALRSLIRRIQSHVLELPDDLQPQLVSNSPVPSESSDASLDFPFPPLSITLTDVSGRKINTSKSHILDKRHKDSFSHGQASKTPLQTPVAENAPRRTISSSQGLDVNKIPSLGGLPRVREHSDSDELQGGIGTNSVTLRLNEVDESFQAEIPPHCMRRAIENWALGPKIGTGMTAQVYLGYNIKTRKRVALKLIPIKNMPEDIGWDLELRLERGSSDWKRLCTEIAAMKRLKPHPNVVALLDSKLNARFIDELGRRFPVVLLVLPWAPHGDLDNLMGPSLEERCGFPPRFARGLFSELLSGVHHLHCSNIYHRDLKPLNILFGPDFRLKIADFGYSTIFDSRERAINTRVFTMAGSDEYAAPEVISLSHEGGYIAEEADIWSLGIILYELLVGKPPWGCADPDMDCDYYNVSEGDWDTFWEEHESEGLPELCSEAKDLLQNMLNPRGSQRIRISQISQHLWLQSCVEASCIPGKNMDLLTGVELANTVRRVVEQQTADIEEDRQMFLERDDLRTRMTPRDVTEYNSQASNNNFGITSSNTDIVEIYEGMDKSKPKAEPILPPISPKECAKRFGFHTILPVTRALELLESAMAEAGLHDVKQSMIKATVLGKEVMSCFVIGGIPMRGSVVLPNSKNIIDSECKNDQIKAKPTDYLILKAEIFIYPADSRVKYITVIRHSGRLNNVVQKTYFSAIRDIFEFGDESHSVYTN